MNAMSKEADIVERLARSLKPFWHYTQNDVIGDAMAEITNIRAECDGLRSANAALKQMVSDKGGLLTALRAERDAAARDMRERIAIDFETSQHLVWSNDEIADHVRELGPES